MDDYVTGKVPQYNTSGSRINCGQIAGEKEVIEEPDSLALQALELVHRREDVLYTETKLFVQSIY